MGKRLLTLGGAALAGAALVGCTFGGGVEAKPAIPAATPAPSESAARRQPSGGRPSTLNPDQTVTGCPPVAGVELAMAVSFPDGGIGLLLLASGLYGLLRAQGWMP